MTAEIYRWSRSNFPQGSIGEQLVPEFIEGRSRTQATIDLPLIRLVGGDYLTRIQKLEVGNLGELLQKPYEDLTTRLRHPSYLKNVIFILGRYLRDVAAGPEGILLSSLFGKDPEKEEAMPINPQIEPIRAQVVREVLADLRPQHQQVLDLAYGLTTGVAKTPREIKQERLEERLKQAKAFLSISSRLSSLRPFHAFGQQSLGRVNFGATCGYEFEQGLEDARDMLITMDDLMVPTDLARIIRQQVVFWNNRERFVGDLLHRPVSAFSDKMLVELRVRFNFFLMQSG